MKNLKAILKSYLKKVISDLHSAIISLIVFALLGLGSIFLFSKTLWNYIKIIIQSSTPLWLTIVLVLVVPIYVHFKKQKTHLSSSKRDYEIRYFTIGNYKWETKIYKSGYFEVDKYPFCVKHDLRFILGSYEKYCPGPENGRCNNSISSHDEFKIYESAKSIIESKIRNKEY
jgi:hypothetical protein